MTATSFGSALKMFFMGTPADPPANVGALYFKSDGLLYKKVGSVETLVEQGPGLAKMAASPAAKTNFSSGAYTILTGWSTTYMNGITYDGAGGFTVQQAGFYSIKASVGFGANATNTSGITVWVNGVRRFTNLGYNGSAVNYTFEIARDTQLAAGDVVTFRALVNTTGQSTETTLGYTSCSIHRFA